MCNTHLNSLSTLANIRLTTKKKTYEKNYPINYDYVIDLFLCIKGSNK